MVTIKKMTVREWIGIPDNPRQRDTERHARRARAFHLKEASSTHAVVAAAVIDGEIACKLDGHTRAYLWNSGELPFPNGATLTVECYDCKDLDEARELYTHFDSQYAVETVVDRLTGACREVGFVPQSPLLKPMKFVTALKFADDCDTNQGREYELMRRWVSQLVELDSWNLCQSILPTGLIALALCLIRQGNEAIARTFFIAYASDKGMKSGDARDGVQALTEHIASRRISKSMSGSDNIQDLMDRGYSAFAAYRDGRLLRQGLRPTARATWDKNWSKRKEAK